MSAIDLILMGILFKQKLSPYGLAKFIEKNYVDKFLKISTPAIYKRCRALSLEGFLVGEVVRLEVQGEKTIYELSESGKVRFYELMEHFSSNFTPLYLESNAFVWHLENLTWEQGSKMVENAKIELTHMHSWIVQHESDTSEARNFSGRMIVKQFRMVLTTLLEWISELASEYQEMQKEKGGRNEQE